MIFARVVPNLKRIGLLTDRDPAEVRRDSACWNSRALPDDGHIDWDELSKPLYDKSA